MSGRVAGRRWARPTEPISHAGRSAAYLTAACLVVTGTAFLIASWDELTCKPPSGACDTIAAAGALISVVALVAIAIGVGIVQTVRRRSVVKDGDTGWTWALGVLFALGLVALAGALPAWSCPAGVHLDSVFGLCITRTSRFEATSRLWLKWLLVIAGLALGLTVIRRPRWMLVTAPIALAAWMAGFGWLLVVTVGRGLTV
jgi:hypothetical protein